MELIYSTSIVECYIIFALSTAIACCYEFFWPLIKEAKSKEIVNEFTQYPILSCFIYMIISTIIAPILVLPLLSSKKAEQFKRGLHRTIVANK